MTAAGQVVCVAPAAWRGRMWLCKPMGHARSVCTAQPCPPCAAGKNTRCGGAVAVFHSLRVTPAANRGGLALLGNHSQVQVRFYPPAVFTPRGASHVHAAGAACGPGEGNPARVGHGRWHPGSGTGAGGVAAGTAPRQRWRGPAPCVRLPHTRPAITRYGRPTPVDHRSAPPPPAAVPSSARALVPSHASWWGRVWAYVRTPRGPARRRWVAPARPALWRCSSGCNCRVLNPRPLQRCRGDASVLLAPGLLRLCAAALLPACPLNAA